MLFLPALYTFNGGYIGEKLHKSSLGSFHHDSDKFDGEFDTLILSQIGHDKTPILLDSWHICLKPCNGSLKYTLKNLLLNEVNGNITYNEKKNRYY